MSKDKPINYNVSAKVKVTIELRNVGRWPQDSDLVTIREQSIKEAVSQIEHMVQAEDGDMEIVGEPTVTVIMLDER